MATRSLIVMIQGRMITMQPSRAEDFPTQVQSAISRRMVMDSTTWPEMCLSGAGIGMECRMPEALTRTVPIWKPTACYAVALGMVMPETRVAPGARAIILSPPTATTVFVARKLLSFREFNQTRRLTGIMPSAARVCVVVLPALAMIGQRRDGWFGQMSGLVT